MLDLDFLVRVDLRSSCMGTMKAVSSISSLLTAAATLSCSAITWSVSTQTEPSAWFNSWGLAWSGLAISLVGTSTGSHCSSSGAIASSSSTLIGLEAYSTSPAFSSRSSSGLAALSAAPCTSTVISFSSILMSLTILTSAASIWSSPFLVLAEMLPSGYPAIWLDLFPPHAFPIR